MTVVITQVAAGWKLNIENAEGRGSKEEHVLPDLALVMHYLFRRFGTP